MKRFNNYQKLNFGFYENFISWDDINISPQPVFINTVAAESVKPREIHRTNDSYREKIKAYLFEESEKFQEMLKKRSSTVTIKGDYSDKVGEVSEAPSQRPYIPQGTTATAASRRYRR